MLSSGNGRHRRPRPTPAAVVTVATAAATGAGIALPLLGATVAQAADSSTWDRVAVCETGGLWSANTGNGFYGGLAITQTTWVEFGGGEYADRPDLASRAQQITVAERILEGLGPDAWPGCEKKTGLQKDTSKPDVDPGTPSPRPTLPGLPLPTLPDVPATPTAGSPSGDSTAGTPSTSPATGPAASGGQNGSGDANGSGGYGDQDGSGDTGGSNTDPESAPPTTGATTSGDAQGTTPGVPGTPPSTTTPADGATTPADPGQGGGRHAKPYSPTDEELAAADRASRTELYSTTGQDATGSSSATPGNANKGDNSGTSGTGAYRIGLGDTLSSIASGHHVQGGWHALYDTNHQVIGDDPNLIKPGQILNLG
ncbi:LysM peptidoglycan-binding domain-containing protein [Actinacidiphila acidipaludis]|uniref:Transglycosylase family protein n=1 Tax=Actinacidiphila acidipaludis TaxID=2873382 RepID=A0ABS7Q147_9ACTN|nr:transglycosylase family protein [Streptomyces acidipaludis]MBY8876865.1 transglycosylase family protein [Streptomyces acidipaludis]